ncbi:hypothetical protein J6590_074862 [Homalodisca vitripennis]|nr:hypothetical protein J6590_074862 [Homalodisca vitripennis]
MFQRHWEAPVNGWTWMKTVKRTQRALALKSESESGWRRERGGRGGRGSSDVIPPPHKQCQYPTIQFRSCDWPIASMPAGERCGQNNSFPISQRPFFPGINYPTPNPKYSVTEGSDCSPRFSSGPTSVQGLKGPENNNGRVCRSDRLFCERARFKNLVKLTEGVANPFILAIFSKLVPRLLYLHPPCWNQFANSCHTPDVFTYENIGLYPPTVGQCFYFRCSV